MPATKRRTTLVVETKAPNQEVIEVINEGEIPVAPAPESTVEQLINQIDAPVSEPVAVEEAKTEAVQENPTQPAAETPVVEENQSETAAEIPVVEENNEVPQQESTEDILRQVRAAKKAQEQANAEEQEQRKQQQAKEPKNPEYQGGEDNPENTATHQIQIATAEAAQKLIDADREKRLAGIQLGIEDAYQTTIQDVGTGQRIGQLLALAELGANSYTEISDQLKLLRQHNDAATCDVVKQALLQSGFKLELPAASEEGSEKKKLSPSSNKLIAGFLPSSKPKTPEFAIFAKA